MAYKKSSYFTYGTGVLAVLMVLGGGWYIASQGGQNSVVTGASSTTQTALAADASTGSAGEVSVANPGTVDAETMFMQNNGVLESEKSGVRVTSDVISQRGLPPEGYQEYRNEKYGFSYYHSPQAKITEYDEGGGAMTLTHENFEKVRGFQVFIIPYSEPLITEERFKKDVPSGVRKNVEDAMLDGVRAVTFNSVDEMLGETREIWVIRNGYLYEITTFTGVGNWFTPIIQSWRWLP